jgi:hypothetical protein
MRNTAQTSAAAASSWRLVSRRSWIASGSNESTPIERPSFGWSPWIASTRLLSPRVGADAVLGECAAQPNARGSVALKAPVPVVGLDSYKSSLKKNADGTVDVYFTPEAPAGQKSNWIVTREGKPFFVMFRIYGPQKGAVDGSWMLNDIERVN